MGRTSETGGGLGEPVPIMDPLNPNKRIGTGVPTSRNNRQFVPYVDENKPPTDPTSVKVWNAIQDKLKQNPPDIAGAKGLAHSAGMMVTEEDENYNKVTRFPLFLQKVFDEAGQ